MIRIPQGALVPKQTTLNIGSSISAVRALRQPGFPDIAEALDAIQASTNKIENVLRNAKDQTFDNITIESGGKVIGFIGSRIFGTKRYEGAYFSELFVGGNDPSTAILFVDPATGDVSINGKIVAHMDGSVTISGATLTLTTGTAPNTTTTTINNAADATNGTRSFVSTDDFTTRKSIITPTGFILLASDGTTAIAKVINVGTDQGRITVSQLGSVATAVMQVGQFIATDASSNQSRINGTQLSLQTGTVLLDATGLTIGGGTPVVVTSTGLVLPGATYGTNFATIGGTQVLKTRQTGPGSPPLFTTFGQVQTWCLALYGAINSSGHGLVN